MTLYIDNDMVLSFSGGGKLKDKNGNFVSGATVKATLYEYDSNNTVGGTSWPVILTEDSPGEYSGVIPYTVEAVDGKQYKLIITAEKDGKKAQWNTRVQAYVRTV